ncbi:MAG: hypothetical protein JNK11_08590, partial [Alphaproteobacteria bacterium]|nr:hypothetical protein [Alphaproteobacteria bacterium]
PAATFAAAALVAALLGGCASDRSGAAAGTTDLAPLRNFAVVLVGVASAGETRTVGPFGRIAPWRLAWLRVDVERNESVLPLRGFLIERSRCERRDSLGNECVLDHQQMQYAAFVVAPGTYMLETIAVFDGEWKETGVTRTGDDFVYKANVRSNALDNKAPWFSVAAGEIVYVGDHVYDLAADPPRLARVDRNLGAAKRALERFKNLPGLPVERGIAAPGNAPGS